MNVWARGGVSRAGSGPRSRDLCPGPRSRPGTSRSPLASSPLLQARGPPGARDARRNRPPSPRRPFPLSSHTLLSLRPDPRCGGRRFPGAVPTVPPEILGFLFLTVESVPPLLPAPCLQSPGVCLCACPGLPGFASWSRGGSHVFTEIGRAGVGGLVCSFQQLLFPSFPGQYSTLNSNRFQLAA